MGNEDSDEKSKMREDILDGKISRWDVTVDEGTNRPVAEGYFGSFTIITIGGKKTLVFCDPRNSNCVPMIDGWYDDVKFTDYGWNPDERFVSEPNPNPLLVQRNGKWTMIGYCGPAVTRNGIRLRKPYCDEWYDCIDNWGKGRSVNSKGVNLVERWYDAVKDGNHVRLTRKCQVIDDGNQDTLAEVKTWDNERIKTDWIEKGRPCYHISGFRFRGAKPGRISTEKALEMIKSHSFGMGFSSMSWAVEDGSVALVFESYSELDME